MKNRVSPNQPKFAGAGLFAAACLVAAVATGVVACSGRDLPAVAPVSKSTATPWPAVATDPSVPPAAEALAGRVFEAAEPAPTF